MKSAIPLIEAIPPALPSFHIPTPKPEWLLDLSSSAVSIGILGLLEALAIAKAIAHKSRQQLDYNRQCLAEGLGNLVGGFFRCMPGAGSLSRTAINYQAGAQSRFSGVSHRRDRRGRRPAAGASRRLYSESRSCRAFDRRGGAPH